MSDISDRRTDLPPRAIGVPDTGQGLFQKFEVRRTDGSSEPGGKHEGCEYFVLDTDHDPHAAAALRAYAAACEASHPLLARDLRDRYHLPAQIPLEVTISTEMVSVPILRRFDQSDPIGWLQVRRDALPPTPDWCFSIGYEALGAEGGQVTDYRLQAVSITSDAAYAKVIEREQTRNAAPLPAGITPEIRRLQAHAFGIARDVAAAFETKHNDGSSSAATFSALADHLLTEPEVVRAITAWAKAIEREVERGDGAGRSEAEAGERTHAKRLLDRHCSLELRCTLSAHHEEWWRLNRDREASEADILQVLAAGLRARRPDAGTNLSQEKRRSTGLGPLVIEATAQWAGGMRNGAGDGWVFPGPAWQKFVTSLSVDPPLELMTSPGVSAPEGVMHQRCIVGVCQETIKCEPGKCAMGPGEQA